MGDSSQASANLRDPLSTSLPRLFSPFLAHGGDAGATPLIHSIAGDLDERVHVVDFTRVELLNVLAPANMMTGSNCVRRGRMVLDSGGGRST